MTDEKQEIREGRRFFDAPDKEGIKYYIAPPTADDIRGADWQYSKIYAKSLVEGITTAAEMTDILTLRGIIGPEFEQRQRELSDNLARKVLELQLAKDIDAKQVLAMGVATAREELFNWNQRSNGPMSNTCEQMSDDSRLEYLTSRMIENEDGSKLWNSYDSFLKERSQKLAVRARFEVMLYLQGLASNFLDNTPEAVAMREVEGELRQKATKAIEELTKKQEDAAAEKVIEEKNKKSKISKKSSNKVTKKPVESVE